jgi:hypothetical protein
MTFTQRGFLQTGSRPALADSTTIKSINHDQASETGRLVLHWRNDAVNRGLQKFGKHQRKFLWGDAAFLNSFILNDSNCNTLNRIGPLLWDGMV